MIHPILSICNAHIALALVINLYNNNNKNIFIILH